MHSAYPDGLGAVVGGLIGNLLYLVLFGKKKLRLHTVPVFVAIVGSLFLFGASEMILGPVAHALAVALMGVWRRRTDSGRAAETKSTSQASGD